MPNWTKSRGREYNYYTGTRKVTDLSRHSRVEAKRRRLTSLAPDIIDAILHSKEPKGMSLEKLRKDLPVRWEEQRKRWR